MLHYLHVGLRITITQSHMHAMQQTHMHKAVTRHVEAKKLLSRRRQSEYSSISLPTMHFFSFIFRVKSSTSMIKIMLQFRLKAHVLKQFFHSSCSELTTTLWSSKRALTLSQFYSFIQWKFIFNVHIQIPLNSYRSHIIMQNCYCKLGSLWGRVHQWA